MPGIGIGIGLWLRPPGPVLDVNARSSAPVLPNFRVSATGSVWAPTSLSSLKAWLAPDSIQSSGGSISSWTDKSGLGNSPAQATSNLQPTLAASAINGYAVADFSGTQYLFTAVDLFAQEYTLAAVMKNRAAAGQVMVSNQSTNNGAYFRANTNRYVGHVNVAESADAAVPLNTWELWLARRTATGPSTELWVNGSQQTITNSTASLNSPSSADFTIGGRLSSGSFSLLADCQIAEVVICNARLSDSDKALLEGYLRLKYGL